MQNCPDAKLTVGIELAFAKANVNGFQIWTGGILPGILGYDRTVQRAKVPAPMGVGWIAKLANSAF